MGAHKKWDQSLQRANLAQGIGNTFSSLSQKTISNITAIADADIRNKRAFDVLAKEIFFSRGCVLVEGYEDAHLLQKYLADESKASIEIFGYGSGGADGIIAWLSASHDLHIPAVGLFDGDSKGDTALAKARKLFKDTKTIMLLQLPTPDIRDKHKLAPDCKTETEEIEKEGVFTKHWVLKEKYRKEMKALVGEMATFLRANEDVPPVAGRP